jgi:glycosyltransferase involved in cell wall biosynthesis
LTQKKVLLISYLFPPVGGSGVQRFLKYTKYLPQFGWDPVVLSVKDINYSVYDQSLLKELPSEVEIIRTGSLDPQRLTSWAMPKRKSTEPDESVLLNPRFRDGSKALSLYRLVREAFAFPDPYVGWIPFAYWQGLKAIRRHKIEAIVVAMPPHSSAFIAKLLLWKTGVPYVLDLRDFWVGFEPGPRFSTRLHKWANNLLEKWALTGAPALTVFGEAIKVTLKERYPNIAKCEVIPNGFDPMDIDGIAPAERTEGKHRIVYSGSLFIQYQESFLVFLAALRILPDEIRNSLEVVFVGRAYSGAEAEVADAGLEGQVRFLGYLSHKEALRYLRSSDAVLLFLSKNNRSAFSGKVFEYLMIGSPIIACVEPDGVCAEMLSKAGCDAWITVPGDAQRLADTLAALTKAGWPRPHTANIDQFSRRELTRRLAATLDRLVAERPPNVRSS